MKRWNVVLFVSVTYMLVAALGWITMSWCMATLQGGEIPIEQRRRALFAEPIVRIYLLPSHFVSRGILKIVAPASFWLLAAFWTSLVCLPILGVCRLMKKRPNKAPEPTPTSVIPRANERRIE